MINIVKAEICTYKLPFNKPFAVSFATIAEQETIILKLYNNDGTVGYGEAPAVFLPLYNHEMPETVIAVLKKALIPQILNKEFETPEQVDDLFDGIKGNKFARNAVSMAVYDLYGKLTNQRLIDIMGGTRTDLQLSNTVIIHEKVEDAVEEARSYMDQSHYIKLKIKPGYDIDQARAIKEEFPEAKLMLDGNSGYRLSDETINTFKELDKLDLYCIEQPLQSYDIIDHAKLQKEIKSKIALDESIESLYDAEKALELGSCKLINIKIPRVGGITEALRINELCKKNNIQTWVGGMFESPVGLGANFALSTVDNVDYPIDYLGAFHYVKDFEKIFAKKPYEVIEDKFRLHITEPGLGVEIDWDFFDTLKTDTIVVE